MKKFNKSFALFLGMAIVSLSACNSTQSKGGSAAETTHSPEEKAAVAIKNIKTISEIFSDGQKVTNVVVEYEKPIDAGSISPDCFEVKDRNVIAAYTNDKAAKTDKDVEGNCVILELEVQNPLLEDSQATDGRVDDYVTTDTATVVQLKDIQATDGTVYAASSQEVSTAASSGIMAKGDKIYLVRSEFESNHFYTDPEWKVVLHYNIFKPQSYRNGETADDTRYPLVLFMPDAGAVSKDWEVVLTQGNGGIVWAEEAWQAENPCFVVTMIYDDKFINDYWEYYENYVEGTMNLVRSLSEEYPIDTGRIYTTGQSMGAMNSFIMMTKDPDLFAAAYCIAGKWDAQELVPLKDSNILVFTSEDDPATKSMNLVAEAWEAAGAVVATKNMDATADQETLSKDMNELFSQDTNLFYCRINSGEGRLDSDGNKLSGNHRYTWRIAYNLPGVKEWLFEQSK